ncbi:MAG: hypothetical protein ACI3XD_04220, partial [Oscillospiraceae bacterium]
MPGNTRSANLHFTEFNLKKPLTTGVQRCYIIKAPRKQPRLLTLKKTKIRGLTSGDGCGKV